jgi:hypothetical protein
MTRPNMLDRCRGKLLIHSLVCIETGKRGAQLRLFTHALLLPFQNLLAKQGLRLLQGLRQGNMQKKMALAKKLLAKLHFLAQEVMPSHPFPCPGYPLP